MRRALLALLTRTAVGRRAVAAAVRADPSVAVEQLGPMLERRARFRSAAFPEAVRGFEDLSFLFSSNQLNMGIALLALDEAAYLYRLVRDLGPATIVEIGRFKGGGTFLLAAALAEGGELYSYDLHVKLAGEYRGEELDRELREALRRYGLDRRVHLLVADSRTAEPPPRPCDLVFQDGDHTYEGVRADYEHWRPCLRPGGHLLFHDAAAPRDFATCHEGVAAVVAEIERDDDAYFSRQDGAGSIVHFTRTDVPLGRG